MKGKRPKQHALIILLGCSMLILSFSLEGTNSSLFATDSPDVKMHGVKVFVKDLDMAMAFYTSFLNLKVEEKTDDLIKLSTGQYPIYLVQSENHIERDLHAESHYGIAFLTHKLLPAIDDARRSSVTVYDTLLSRNGIGIHIPIADPSGNLLHFMEVQVGKRPKFEGFRLYNSGMTINNMDLAETFYAKHFGLSYWSRDYLPDALPLKHADDSFAFMLHQDTGLISSTHKYGSSPGVVLMLQTSDLSAYADFLKSKDIDYQLIADRILIKDTNGNTIEMIEKK